ncbi:MAG: cobalamin adenosyltransferase [Clostridiales bacterium]|nr:cobalamin adenosyltransferase [Clostridiales bacterium]
MEVLTEGALRTALKNTKLSKYKVRKGTIITPSARQFLKEKNIELIIGEENHINQQIYNQNDSEKSVSKPSYLCAYCGDYYEQKLEHMTHLQGNKLVYKDHPRIKFRGKLDSLQAKILEVQFMASRIKAEKLVTDLEEVLQFVRNMVRAEVLEENLSQTKLFGLEEQELRTLSHNPSLYFKIAHITPTYDMGEILVGLNSLRTAVRETEIGGIKTFRKHEVIERQDIIQALNRLSSAVYIMMLRWQTRFYK